jgi:hypothetical protein
MELPKREIKKLEIRPLIPPPPMQIRMIEKDKDRAHSNIILKYIKKFFGDGL